MAGPAPRSRTDTTALPPTGTARAGKRASSSASSEAGKAVSTSVAMASFMACFFFSA